MSTSLVLLLVGAAVVLAIGFVLFQSLEHIGPTELGLVTKRFGRRLSSGNVIATSGEAGYQEGLLMPGWRFKLWPLFGIAKHPWVQVPAGEVGLVIAQVGEPLPVGAKSSVYRAEFGDFRSVEAFLQAGGQKGVQRPVLPPGSLVPIHPVAFLVITSAQVFGVPVAGDLPRTAEGALVPASFGLTPEQLKVTVIGTREGKDQIGIVYALEGDPLPKGAIACRLGGYDDVEALEAGDATVPELVAALLGSKNALHNNYQDYQGFLDGGGRIGLQHDPLLPGAYLLNPFLVRVELTEMLEVNQGEVAVVKSYVGLPTLDTSGDDFKFGAIVQPGHQGIWSEPLRTGKYPLNPHCYGAVVVPTSILTLNWAESTSSAHNLDKALSPIESKSREGFVFGIELQVQIHVPDTKAPKVISMVGTMQNLVNEVLQSAVGNYFRNTLQGLAAVTFIETRDAVQQEAEEYIKRYLSGYDVETRGVYIQDVDLPQKLVEVLQAREIANQQRATFEQERAAQDERLKMEKSRGLADKQGALAASEVAITIAKNEATAKKAEADGVAAFTKETGQAEADVIQAKGVARAAGYKAQVEALGQGPTAAVAVASELSGGQLKVVPDVLVAGGGGGIEALAGSLVGLVQDRRQEAKPGAVDGQILPPAPDEPVLVPVAAEPALVEPVAPPELREPVAPA
jgi:uncharacterized membrane protein YqiK